jgi:hypothetical protein
MSCPAGYVELPVDKMRCSLQNDSTIKVLKVCPSGTTIGINGICISDVLSTVLAKCPTGYFPIPNDSSNCSTSTSSTIVKKLCPTGYVLQENGLCGVGKTYATTGPTYCGPQYSGKVCKYLSQVTPGITAATGTESGPNMICAFQVGDAQFPCDPGCCLTEETESSASASTGTDTSSEPAFPIWAIILLIVLGAIGLSIFAAWAAKKMSRRSSNGH